VRRRRRTGASRALRPRRSRTRAADPPQGFSMERARCRSSPTAGVRIAIADLHEVSVPATAALSRWRASSSRRTDNTGTATAAAVAVSHNASNKLPKALCFGARQACPREPSPRSLRCASGRLGDRSRDARRGRAAVVSANADVTPALSRRCERQAAAGPGARTSSRASASCASSETTASRPQPSTASSGCTTLASTPSRSLQ
jgi:hypothetical protein